MKKQGSRIRKSKGSRVPGFQDSSEFNALDPSTPRILESFRSSRGFTAIEATMIVVVLAILAVSIIVKNPFSTQDYATIAADQLIADIQYVQMKAMGTRRRQNIFFFVNTSSYNIREGATIVEQRNLPKDVKIRTANFNGSNILTFNTLGEPTFTGIDGSIELGDSASTYKIITVLQITGKAQ